MRARTYQRKSLSVERMVRKSARKLDPSWLVDTVGGDSSSFVKDKKKYERLYEGILKGDRRGIDFLLEK